MMDPETLKENWAELEREKMVCPTKSTISPRSIPVTGKPSTVYRRSVSRSGSWHGKPSSLSRAA